jgi:hypothetical protein
LTRGGQWDFNRRKTDGSRFPRTRAITGLDQGLKINKDLWTLAESFFPA